MPDWDAWRGEFPTLARKTYLNTVSLGALSRRSRAAVTEFLDLWEEHGASAWYRLWLGEAQRLRESFARLVHASPEEVALLPNVSSALGALASGLDFGSRPRVVTSALDFPTIAHAFRSKPEVDVRAVASVDGVSVDAAEIAGEIDDRTACVATSHVYYATGARVDLRAACKAARAHGALSIVDAYQSAGQVATDVREIGCDALVTGGLKWLLGGPGVAFVFVRRDALERLSPTVTGWFGDANQFAFDNTTWTPRADARKLEAGTPAMAAVYAARAGLDLVLEAGQPAIEARTRDLARDLAERLADAGYSLGSPTEEERRTGIVIVRRDDAPEAVKRLAAERIVVDHRPGRVRVAPYFYNTFNENEVFVDALRKASPAPSAG